MSIKKNISIMSKILKKEKRTKYFLNYLKFKNNLIINNILKDKKKSESFLGIKINFYRYLDFIDLFEEIFINEVYKFKSKKKNPFIIDCGANIGFSIIYFKYKYPKSKIIGFEAFEETFDILEKNVKSNKLKDVKLINKAVYNSKKSLTFYTDPKNSLSLSNSIIKNESKTKKTIVNADLLSNYIKKNEEIDLLKIDIEGSEGKVFEDLNKSKKIRNIKNIYFEFHNSNDGKNKLSKIIKILEDNNFIYKIKANSLNSKKKSQTFFIYASKN